MNEELFWAYCDQFYGYGNWKARFWFVGIEENGASDINQAHSRINHWDVSGRGHLKDLPSYCRALAAGGEGRTTSKWFEQFRAQLQKTWKQLIRIRLAASGQLSASENANERIMRDYQVMHYGRAEGETADLSLLPLPCRRPKMWGNIYQQHVPNNFPHDRAGYEDRFLPQRVNFLRAKANDFQPAIVVIYSIDFARRFMDNPVVQHHNEWPDVIRGTWGGTPVLGIYHPTWPGWHGRGQQSADGYYARVGGLIREMEQH